MVQGLGQQFAWNDLLAGRELITAGLYISNPHLMGIQVKIPVHKLDGRSTVRLLYGETLFMALCTSFQICFTQESHGILPLDGPMP